MQKLEPTVGLASVVAISISAMLGSGIFVLPGLAAVKTGPSVWIAYVVAGLIVLPAALSKAELATAMPTSGGSYVYIDRAFGPQAGTVAGLGLWLSLLLKSSFALVGFGAYLIVLVHFESVIPAAMIALLLIVGLNIVGIKKVSKVQILMVGVSVVGLCILAAMGLPKVDSALLQPMFPHGAGGFVAAAGFVFVSYAGVTKIAAIAEEVKNPNRNLPLGMLLSLAIAVVLYGVVVLVLVGNVPVSVLANVPGEGGADIRPVYTLASRLGGATAGTVAAVIGVLTMVSMANAGLLAASRFPFAMSRDNLLPASLHAIHVRFLTPVACILLTGCAMAACILFLDVEKLAKIASSFMILAFIAENLCVIVLRRSGVRWYRPAYRAPWFPWLQIIGTILLIGLLAMTGVVGLVSSLAMATVGVIVYQTYGRRHTDRRGALRRIGDQAPPSMDSVRAAEHAPLMGDAQVVVGLFGHEHSSEMCAEVGAALADGGKVEVLHVTVVPDQLTLDEVPAEQPRVAAIRRRIEATVETTDLDVDFHSVVSRDAVAAIEAISTRLHCQWVLLEWSGRTNRWLFPAPRPWLLSNMDCNLALFYDFGVRSVRKVLVLAKPGPHDALVVSTADRIALKHGATLTFVRYIRDGEESTAVNAQVDYLDQLSQLCSSKADVSIVRGKSRRQALVEATASYDLMVMGVASHESWLTAVFGTVEDRVAAQAACSVLRLKTPATRVHESFEDHVKRRDFDALGPFEHGCAAARVEATTKEALFAEFARAFAASIPGISAKEMNSALWAREKTQNTAIGDGVALPHATLGAAERSYLGVFTTAKPIEHEALDDKPVDVFFVTLGPPSDRQAHLRLLAGISRLVLRTSLLERLRKAKTKRDIIEAVEVSAAELAFPSIDGSRSSITSVDSAQT
jgi:APA family basic amino acid/polyamine antiporter